MRTRKFEALKRNFSCELFPEYDAGLWYVYILTDIDRSELKCGICSNLHRFYNLMVETGKLAPSFGQPIPSRVVFLEGISSHFQAEETLNRILYFTRVQKEKLVRRNNPNWKDLLLSLGFGVGVSFGAGVGVGVGFGLNHKHSSRKEQSENQNSNSYRIALAV